MARLVRVLDRVIDAFVNGAMWLALPMALLLFLQWPLREVVAQFSREANDAAQVLFALLVSVAITCATRAQAHVAADALASRYRPRTRQGLIRIASLVILMPWSIFVLVFAWRSTVQSVLQFEGFPETFNPGYFMIRVALVLMALLVLAQAVVDAARPLPEDDR
ncbi:MAG: TRAP transporter small permease subunit [Betaproteobacteria bacterium]